MLHPHLVDRLSLSRLLQNLSSKLRVLKEKSKSGRGCRRGTLASARCAGLLALWTVGSFCTDLLRAVCSWGRLPEGLPCCCRRCRWRCLSCGTCWRTTPAPSPTCCTLRRRSYAASSLRHAPPPSRLASPPSSTPALPTSSAGFRLHPATEQGLPRLAHRLGGKAHLNSHECFR